MQNYILHEAHYRVEKYNFFPYSNYIFLNVLAIVKIGIFAIAFLNQYF